MYKHILVAMDGSATAQCALFEALNLVQDGAQIRVVAVVENPLAGYAIPAMTYGYNLVYDAMVQDGLDLLKKVKQDTAHLAHIKIDTHLIKTPPDLRHQVASAILRDAEDHHADVIVMGTHGRGGLKRFFLGSVAEQVIRESCIPVLIVRGEQDEPAES